MPTVLRFARGAMKPPFGALINPEHPFVQRHLMSVLFHGQGSVIDVGSPDTGPVVYANSPLASFGFDPADLPPRLHLNGGSSPVYASNLEGVCLRCVVGNKLTICDSRIFSTDRLTLCFIRRKTDTTNRNSAMFSNWSAWDSSIIHIACPWGDGVVALDYGGSAGANKLSVSGLSFSTFIPERWVFTAGPRGSSIWQNGVKVASQSTAITRTASSGNVILNGSDAGGIGTDEEDFNFFMAIDDQWSDEMCRWWSAEPYAHLYSETSRRRYFVLGAPLTDGFTIDGTARDILQNWSISSQLNERGTMRFGVKSMDASYRPGLREAIDFRKFDIHFFAGHIHHTDEAGLGGYGVVPIVTQCGATDFKALADRRKVSMTIAAGTLKEQIHELAEPLEVYGVTVDPAQVDGPAMPEMVLTGGSVFDGFQKLSIGSGYAFDINNDKVLRMFAPGVEDAPFDIEDSVDGRARVKGDVRVSPTTVDYGNHVTVKFTTPAVAAYAFFELTDVPSEDETVTVGSQVYTFKASPSGGNEVQIGGSADASVDNLIGAIFPAHPEVVAFEQSPGTARITAIEAGAAGNGIQVSTTCVDGTWKTEGGGEVSHLNLGSDAALTGVAIAQDIPAQDGGANLFELVFEEPDVENEEAAQQLADGYLARSLVQPREIRYRTRLHGLWPGMKQHIEVPGRNVDADCLITTVEISPEGSALINYDVTAVEGLVIVASHQEKWRRMGGRAA